MATKTSITKLTPAQEKEARMNLWESQTTEQLEELVKHNQNILDNHKKSIQNIEMCQTELKTLLDTRKCKAIREKLASFSEEEQQDILTLIPHSVNCERKKYSLTSYSGFNFSYNPPRIICPYCALKYIFDNPWYDIDFKITVDFDFTYYSGGGND